MPRSPSGDRIIRVSMSPELLTSAVGMARSQQDLHADIQPKCAVWNTTPVVSSYWFEIGRLIAPRRQ